MIALATTSRGARSASSCTPCMKRRPVVVDEERALAADRLGDQRLLAAGVRRRATSRSGGTARTPGRAAPRRRAARAPCRRRWTTDGLVVGEKTWPSPPLASTTARQQHRADAVALALAHHVQGDARRRRRRRRGAGRRPARAAMTSISGAALRPRRSGPAGSPRRWRRRRRARSGRGGGRPRGSARARRRRSWSKSVPSAISSRTASGPSVTRTRTASTSQTPGAGDQGVVQVLVGGVARAERRGDAALRPLRRAGAEDVLGDDQDLADPAARSRSAAVSPAMPEPMTTTSASVVQPGAGAARRRAAGVRGRLAIRAG